MSLVAYRGHRSAGLDRSTAGPASTVERPSTLEKAISALWSASLQRCTPLDNLHQAAPYLQPSFHSSSEATASLEARFLQTQSKSRSDQIR
jgi:hypothetical protein